LDCRAQNPNHQIYAARQAKPTQTQTQTLTHSRKAISHEAAFCLSEPGQPGGTETA